ncbi:MAG: filamentous hemagglutinin outer membrane protein, partial [Candidatus Magnetoglobus multicellularis str. Araruama]
MKIIEKKIIVFFVSCIFVLSFSLTYAIDYKADGTAHPSGITSNGLGTEVTIDNNQYDIKGGSSMQGNLFHSFDQFNLHTGESAFFHDTGHTNTIARISGDNYSWINGKITSYADNLFLLNPNGWIFGENASIDVSGSFHVNTADYIKFSDGNQFHADVSKNSILTIESPEAFGFISDQSGSIVFENSKLSLNKTVSIIGNGIELIGSEIENTEGFINICSVSSEGEASLLNSDSKVSLAFNKKGMLSIRENSAIGYNKIFISGSDVTLQDKSLLVSLTI